MARAAGTGERSVGCGAKAVRLLDAKYNAFVANGLNVENPNSNIKPWLSQAHDSIAAQIAGENASSFSVNSAVTVNADLATITGTAPVNIKTVLINGVRPVTWTSVAGFQVTVPLKPGNNVLNVSGVDVHGQPIPGATGTLNVVYNGVLPSPVGQVVLNEIMYQPAKPNAQYVELYNTSPLSHV